jgi:uncharacterized protein YndB with AHSA1/START domain
MVALSLAAPSLLRAEVIEASATALSIRIATPVAAPPTTVYAALVNRVGVWWDSEHTWSGRAANLSIVGRAGGCFCETLPSGGSVEHLAVIWADPGKTLRMTGALGPLQELAVTGTMTWSFAEQSGRTVLELTYVVNGYRRGGMEPMAQPVDQVLSAQVNRLKRYVESGRPD